MAACLVLALAAGVAMFLRLARQPSGPGEPFVQPEPAGFRLTGLRTSPVNLGPSELATARLEYDLPPLRQPELVLTNMVLQTWQLQWRQAIPAPTPSLWNDGIESAERINELILRRQREEWRRTQGL